ncbi:hypothetical protein SASPL_126814 [Salvia splendens]|uniref:Rhodanese domain-containing protein n=1 Tax=Salvia splendens TaxID=180675 RepID=A0A8X8XHN5_SALSN|nr:hypothetical protein SASPL_126814 [Salvia splendens]
MAGITFCHHLAFSSQSNLSPSWLIIGATKRPQLHVKRSVTKAEVSFVDSDEAKKLIAVDGYAVIDVRDRTQFERAHIKNCYHVPLFIQNNDNDLGMNDNKEKRAQQFLRLFSSESSKLLLVCQEGLRSAAAAYKLEEAGYQNIACITSGLQSVKPGTFDAIGSTELQDAGKAGLIQVQGKISAVLGTVLICAFLFITFFPDQAEKLFQLAPTS